jgi:hypothetical protein
MRLLKCTQIALIFKIAHMKRLITLSLIILLQIGVFIAKPTPTKRALIVAIGNYPEVTGWKSISSLNDIAIIQGALSKQGFSDISVIKDGEATKAGIVKALNELKSRCLPGDIVVVHFSSHGQQITDNNRDEIDGYDEAIVAYGAPAVYDPGYEGENHLRDEELGEKLDDIRQQLGKDGDVLILVDACHSGTATRGEAKTRGGVPAFGKPANNASNIDKEEIGVFEKNNAASRGNEAAMSPMVVISAARADELNYEYEGYGSLSVAIARSFENLSGEYSYRSLFSKIVKEMSVIAPKQNPAIEGDVDRKLFGGNVVNQEPYYTLYNIDGDALSIEGGAFTGLNEGTTIKVYPSGTIQIKDQQPLAVGNITYADAFSCNALLDRALPGKMTDYWVFADERTFGDVGINLSLKNIGNAALKESLTKFADEFALTSINEEDAEFRVIEKAGKIALERVQDGELFKFPGRGGVMGEIIPTDDDFRTLKSVISNYAQGKFLKNLEIGNPDYNVELSLIPVRVENDKVVDTLDITSFTDAGGMAQFGKSDKALLKIVNNSSFPVYFNIIDIQPDGQVNPVVPNPRKNENPADFRIAAKDSFILRGKYITFSPPYGTETFKIFASYSPLNFAPILTTRGAGDTRGLNNNLEKLFANSYTMSRGAGVESLSADADAATFSYTFKIKP